MEWIRDSLGFNSFSLQSSALVRSAAVQPYSF